MSDETEIASIVGAQITALYSDGEDSISWILDNGRVITFEGSFDIFLTTRNLQ